jgi:hypothetical protein
LACLQWRLLALTGNPLELAIVVATSEAAQLTGCLTAHARSHDLTRVFAVENALDRELDLDDLSFDGAVAGIDKLIRNSAVDQHERSMRAVRT